MSILLWFLPEDASTFCSQEPWIGLRGLSAKIRAWNLSKFERSAKIIWPPQKLYSSLSSPTPFCEGENHCWRAKSCDRKITSLKTFKSFHPLTANCQTTDCKGSFDYCAYKFHTICLLSSRWKGSLKAASIFCLFFEIHLFQERLRLGGKNENKKWKKKKVVSQEQTNYICVLQKSGTYQESPP